MPISPSMIVQKCRRCYEKISYASSLQLCYECERLMVFAASKFHISIESAINRVWTYGPDRKGCTKLWLS